jgi:hypothetical protein
MNHFQTEQKIIDLTVNELKYYIEDYIHQYTYNSHKLSLNEVILIIKQNLFENTHLCTDIYESVIEYVIQPINLYDPCFGSGLIFNRLTEIYPIINDNMIYGNEIEVYDCKINNPKYKNVRYNSNCLETYFDMKYDIITADLPYSVRNGITYDTFNKQCQQNDIDIKAILPYVTYCTEEIMLYKSIFNLADGGILQIIIPTSIGYANQYTRLRRWLIENVTIKSIITTKKTEHSNIYCFIITLVKNGPSVNTIKLLKDNNKTYITVDELVDNNYNFYFNDPSIG